MYEISRGVYYIMPYHILKDLPPAEAETCAWCLGTPGVTIGSGPYEFSTKLSESGAEFTAVDDWWKVPGGVEIKKVVFRVQPMTTTVAQIEAGELDLAIRVPTDSYDRLSKLPGMTAELAKGVGVFALPFNSKFITDKRMRQAIALAINRDQIMETIIGGRADPHYCGVPIGFTMYEGIDRCEYNPERARELLAASGYDVTKPIRFGYSTASAWALVIPVIQEQLKENLGLTLELIPEDTAAFVKRLLEVGIPWDAYGSYGGNEGVGWFVSRRYFNCDPAANWFEIPADECIYDDYFKRALATTVPAEQDTILKELATILQDDMRQINLWQPNDLHVYTNRLGGGFKMYPSEAESFEMIERWTLAPPA